MVNHASHLKTNFSKTDALKSNALKSSALKSNALEANIHAPSRAAKNSTLNVNKEKITTDFKPLSTRALEKTKQDRSGSGKKLTKPTSKPASKSNHKSNKNKGKPKR